MTGCRARTGGENNCAVLGRGWLGRCTVITSTSFIPAVVAGGVTVTVVAEVVAGAVGVAGAGVAGVAGSTGSPGWRGMSQDLVTGLYLRVAE